MSRLGQHCIEKSRRANANGDVRAKILAVPAPTDGLFRPGAGRTIEWLVGSSWRHHQLPVSLIADHRRVLLVSRSVDRVPR
jgi:hypothetical protein